MSQAKTIYSIFTRSHNPAADAALLLALPKAEPPYQTAILETILDRARTESTLELVRSYHRYPADWQNLMTARIERLAGALYQAADLPDCQSRSNVLTMIYRANAFSLSNLVCLLLRDREESIAWQAGQTLESLALGMGRAAPPTAESGTHTPRPEESGGRRNPNILFRSSLQNAVRQYPLHKQKQAILSAMLYAAATDTDFWGETLDPWQAQHAAVKEWMENRPHPELARFTVSALRHHHLRGHAARILLRTTEPAYLAAMAEQILEWFDASTASGLQWMKNPAWLEEPVEVCGFSDKAMKGMIFLTEHLQAEVFQKAEFLYRLLAYCQAEAGMAILSLLEPMQAPNRLEILLETLHSRYEPMAEEALRQIVRLQPPHLTHILSRQLRSHHGRVRELAEQFFRRTAFVSFWKQFDRMPPARRRLTGKAVFKLDPAAQARWIRLTKHHNPAMRLRAVQMARSLQRISLAAPEIIHLADDPDVRVRSCAVAALGELHPPAALEAEKRLVDRLYDADPRVCANAVEAAEKQNLTHTQPILEAFSRDSHPRVRANSLKTLLRWKAESARQTMQEMLHDPRPGHRRSALWLMRTMPREASLQELLNQTENQHESVSV